ncbi:DUF5448 family protein [Enterobacter hormaechei]|uniref:DUF5448 family protein n=1 Tax=Enterobacter hormaechei TaxID=158836 RepID=UPI0012597241|nr:DUF5448 family protein [Enterobacter hormaechei]EKW6202866.1 DUF5448 family protein [Enterobacter hormaechei]VAG02475.1 Uncharacterised protein [Enterobacter hormaechei]
MSDTNVTKLTDYDLKELQRDIAREIERRASGPTRVVYVVTEWGEHRAFVDFRCAAICFSDIAKGVMEDAATEEGKKIYDLNKGTLLYGIRPVEMALGDYEAKVAQKYFDDVCYEKRLPEFFPGTEEAS